MKLIPLSRQGKNRNKYFAQVDDEDYDFLMQWNWSITHNKKATLNNIVNSGCSIYAARTGGILMHRVIMGTVDSKIFIDHIDHNGLNNQRPNLREASHLENTRNQAPRGTSKYLGVNLRKTGTKNITYLYWRSQIKITNKKICLGNFPFTLEGEIEAAQAYDEAAKKYFGEFANLNFK